MDRKSDQDKKRERPIPDREAAQLKDWNFYVQGTERTDQRTEIRSFQDF